MRTYVLKNVPSTSRLHQIMKVPLLRKTVVFCYGKLITESNEFAVTETYPLRNGCKMLSPQNKMVYKNVNHSGMNSIISKLSGDIETNPGPLVVDPSKTIHVLIVKEMV